MNRKLKKFRNKLRKGADGGNLALVALAVGVIIIIGMYVFTKVVGGNTEKIAGNVNTGLNAIANESLAL